MSTATLRFEVPGRCVTGNQSFRFGRNGRRYTAKEAKEFKERVRNICWSTAARAKWKPLLSAAVRIDAFNQRGDIDGLCKVLLDGMNGVAYRDDRCINVLHIYKLKDKDGPRMSVQVKEHE